MKKFLNSYENMIEEMLKGFVAANYDKVVKKDERTIALSFNELRSVKNVILVAIGARKKEVIKAALKSGLIKVFMTDEDTARTIFGEN